MGVTAVAFSTGFGVNILRNQVSIVSFLFKQLVHSVINCLLKLYSSDFSCRLIKKVGYIVGEFRKRCKNCAYKMISSTFAPFLLLNKIFINLIRLYLDGYFLDT